MAITLDELYDKAETIGSYWLRIKDEIYEQALDELHNEGLVTSSDNVIGRQESILAIMRLSKNYTEKYA